MIGKFQSLLEASVGDETAFALIRLGAYVAVSAAAFVVDFSIYRFALPMLPTAAAAAAIGFLCGVMTHYAISSRIAFTDILKARGGIAEAPVVGQFFAAGGTGLVVTTAVVWSLADLGGYHPYVAKAFAVALSFASVFAVMRLYVLGNFLRRTPSA